MKAVVIGLGSMGKRRIRCLQALGVTSIVGFDKRADRCAESTEKYGVPTFQDIDQAWAAGTPTLAIISLPPDLHARYMRYCLEKGVPFFVEASVISDELAEIDAEAKKKSILAAPSATMTFNAGVRRIKEIVDSNGLGKISNILYHSGQYLPDWHPYESVADFYVSNPATGGAREILPFELTWITHVFGLPKRVAGHVRKTIEIKGAEKIDDTYNCMLDFGSFLSVITIDVVSRCGVRRLLINGSDAQLIWEWQTSNIRIYDPKTKEWITEEYNSGAAASGYTTKIGEAMYIEEIRAFLAGVKGDGIYHNTLTQDIKVLSIMEKLERSERELAFIEV